MKVSPSSDFLYALASEAEKGKMGGMCKETAKDWVAQNAPKEAR